MNILKNINKLTRKIDRLLGVEHTRKDYIKEHTITYKIKKQNLNKDLQTMIKSFKEYVGEELFEAILTEDKILIEILIKYLRENNYAQIGNKLEQIYKERVLDSEFYKNNGFVNFDDLKLSQEDLDFFLKLDQIFIQLFLREE